MHLAIHPTLTILLFGVVTSAFNLTTNAPENILSLPGNTHFHHCDQNFDHTQSIKFDTLYIVPEKPRKGSTVSITVVGQSLVDIEEPMIFWTAGWYGVEKSGWVNPCQGHANFINCPIKASQNGAGSIRINHTLQIPKNLPGHRHYHGKLSLRDGERGKEVGCIKGKVTIEHD